MSPSNVWQLNQAAALGDQENLRLLLDKGVPADAVMPDTGMTALMVAADADIARLLIRAGAAVNRADPHGWTALHHAATRVASVEVAKQLLAAGAAADLRNDRGETPLLLAGLLFVEAIDPSGGADLLTLLTSRWGADINVWDNEGWTLLHQAAGNDEPTLAAIALKLGANPDIRTPLGESPREMAGRLNSRAFIDVLRKFTGPPGNPS